MYDYYSPPVVDPCVRLAMEFFPGNICVRSLLFLYKTTKHPIPRNDSRFGGATSGNAYTSDELFMIGHRRYGFHKHRALKRVRVKRQFHFLKVAELNYSNSTECRLTIQLLRYRRKHLQA